ncbi:kinase-like protein, partial [Auricularia subglabra TFB-10046 SS5]
MVYTVAGSEFVRREVETWKALSHRHILPFYGSCSLGLGQLCLVSPYMACGDMKTFLRDASIDERLILLRQVAEAILYLHSVVGRVHGDLKCSNVMISGDHSAFLADFGLSTLIERTDPTMTMIRAHCTVPFAAPELLGDIACSEHGVIPDLSTQPNGVSEPKPRSKTIFSDIYAFGMLIY